MGNSTSRAATDKPYDPTQADILEVYQLLNEHLPLELVTPILSFAEYHCKSTASMKYKPALLGVDAGHRGELREKVALLTPAVQLDEELKIRGARVQRVTITTVSRDQGFSSFPALHGTTEGSSSFFTFNILRPPPESGDPQEEEQDLALVLSYRSHSNIHASRQLVKATIDIPIDVVLHIQEGDRLAVHACAQYTLWANIVSEVTLSTFVGF